MVLCSIAYEGGAKKVIIVRIFIGWPFLNTGQSCPQTFISTTYAKLLFVEPIIEVLIEFIK